MLKYEVCTHFLILPDADKPYLARTYFTVMVTQRDHDRIYNAGRREQLEQDISMIRDIVDRSEDYMDFRTKLSNELRKLDQSITES